MTIKIVRCSLPNGWYKDFIETKFEVDPLGPKSETEYSVRTLSGENEEFPAWLKVRKIDCEITSDE